MEDIMLAIVIGLTAGFILRTLYDRFSNNDEAEDDGPMPRIFDVDKIDASYFAYDESETFVAQEPTLQALVDRLVELHTFIALATANEEVKTELLSMAKQA